MSWHDVLMFPLNEDGLNIALSAILSIAAEYWPWFQRLGKQQKIMIYSSLCLCLPLLAVTLGILTDGWQMDWNTVIWPAVRVGATAAGAVAMVRAGVKASREPVVNNEPAIGQ